MPETYMPYASLAPLVRRLDNGLTIALEPLPYVRSVTVGAWVKTGSANEPAELCGISHFLEHLFFKGTETRSARDIVDEIEGKGGQLNAFTSREYTCIYGKSLDTQVDTLIDVMADILKHSRFPDLERERKIVLEEIVSSLDVPEDYVYDAFAERMWPGHPLGRPVAGYQETVATFDLQTVRNYYNTWCHPGALVLTVAGNFDPDRVCELLRAEFEGLHQGPLPERGLAPRFTQGVHQLPRAIAQNHFCFGFPGAALGDPRRYVHDILSNAVGGGFTSRLFDRVREREGLAYAIYSFNSSYFTAGMQGVYAAVAPENLSRTLDICAEELRKLREEPLSGEEMESNREQLKCNVLMSLESTFNRMARMGKSLMYYGRVLTLDEIIGAIDAVTPEDVMQLADELFRPPNTVNVVLGPETSEAGLELAL